MDRNLNNKIEFVLGIQEIALWTILIHLNITHVRTIIISFSLNYRSDRVRRLRLPFHCYVEGFVKTFVILVPCTLIEGNYGDCGTHLFILLQ